MKDNAPSRQQTDGRPMRDGSLLYRIAITAFIIMIAGTMLYPDTFTRAGMQLGPFRISAMVILFAIAAPPVFIFFWSRRKTLKPGLFDAVLLLMVGFIVIRGLAAATNSNELGLNAAFAGYILLVYYGASVLGQNASAVRAVFVTLTLLTVVISAYAILEFMLNNNFIYGALTEEKVPIKSTEFHRSGSSLGQPVALGIFLVTVAPMLIYNYISSANKNRRIFYGLAIVLASIALLLSFSKGSWMAAVVILVAVLIYIAWNRDGFLRKLKPFFIPLSILAISFLLLVSIFSSSFSFNLFSSERREESFSMRTNMWSKAPDVFLDNFLIGVGMWQSDDVIYHIAYYESENASRDLEYGEGKIPMDNLYLMVLTESGLIGFTLFMALLAMMGRQSWMLIRAGGRSAGLVITLSLGIIGILIGGMTADSLFIWPILVIFWLEAGFIRSQGEMLIKFGSARNAEN